jgi:hypothetical protein
MRSKLELLMGERVINVSSGLSSVFPLEDSTKDNLKTSMLVYTQVIFENYTLNIYNDHELVSEKNHSLLNIVGEKVIGIQELDKEANIKLENDDILKINLKDEAYNDPEAMSLNGPDNLCIVWN